MGESGFTTMQKQTAERHYETDENRISVVRLAHACLVAGLSAILLLSLFLEPDPRGLGTHEQLLPLPCNFRVMTGLPCPFCGMTTAFAHMARGELREACLAQPMGVLGFTATILLLPFAAGGAIFGKNLIGAALRLPLGKLGWALGIMVLLSWLFKIFITVTKWTG